MLVVKHARWDTAAKDPQLKQKRVNSRRAIALLIAGAQNQLLRISKRKLSKETLLWDHRIHLAQRAPRLLSSVNEVPMRLSRSKNAAKAKLLSALMRLYRVMTGTQFKCIAKTSAVTACSKFVRALPDAAGWIRTAKSPRRELKTLTAATSPSATWTMNSSSWSAVDLQSDLMSAKESGKLYQIWWRVVMVPQAAPWTAKSSFSSDKMIEMNH